MQITIFERQMPWYYGDGEGKGWFVELIEGGVKYVGIYSVWAPTKENAQKYARHIKNSARARRHFKAVADLGRERDKELYE